MRIRADAVVQPRGKYADYYIAQKSHFYGSEILKNQIQAIMDRAIKSGPVKIIKNITKEEASTIELKRIKAMKYARKYNRRLKWARYVSCKRPLTEKECDIIIKIGKYMDMIAAKRIKGEGK